MYWTLRRPHSRIELYLSESRFISGDVLLQQSEQRFCLLGAEIDSLEISNLHLRFGLLLQGAEGEKEIPDVHAHLDAIRVILAIARVVGQFHVRLVGNCHTLRVYQQQVLGGGDDKNCQRWPLTDENCADWRFGKVVPGSLLAENKGLGFGDPVTLGSILWREKCDTLACLRLHPDVRAIYDPR